MGRTEKYPIKKVVGFDQGLMDRLDEYRRKQTPIPNLSEAIRDLLSDALLEKGIA